MIFPCLQIVSQIFATSDDLSHTNIYIAPTQQTGNPSFSIYNLISNLVTVVLLSLLEPEASMWDVIDVWGWEEEVHVYYYGLYKTAVGTSGSALSLVAVV